jgi:hypothetical protein
MRKKDDCGCIATRLNVCPWASLIAITKRIFIGNCFLHYSKGMAGYDGHM